MQTAEDVRSNSAATAGIDRLRPELIGLVFGRPHSVVPHAIRRFVGPRATLLTVGLLGLFAVFALAAGFGQLEVPYHVPAAIQLIARPPKTLDRVGLALWQDPEGIVLLLVAFATPLFCAEQVNGIKQYVPLNVRNLAERAVRLPVDDLNRSIERTNLRFKRLGSRRWSAYYLLGAAAFSAALYILVCSKGLLESWNRSATSSTLWRRRVYDGWWANWHHEPLLALTLWAVLTYGAYFLAKQVTMGVIFALFVRTAARWELGVTPDLLFNTDGWWGMRPVRRFMQWTYGSTLSHLLLTIGFWLFWLPISAWSILAVVVVVLFDGILVIYPSALAYHAAVAAKTMYVKDIMAGDDPLEVRQKAIDDVWARPNLPFRAGSALTAVSVYLLVPLILAIISRTLTG